MKAKINIRKFIEDHADHNDLLLLHTGILVDELFETNNIPEEREIDLEELLAEGRLIAHIWSTDDVRERRPDLTEDQAWEVLKECRNRLDSESGLSWDDIEYAADELYGPKVMQSWVGRIEITISNTDGYGWDEVSNRLQDMCVLLATDMPDVQAIVEKDSIRLFPSCESQAE